MGIPYNRTQIIQTALNILGFPLIQSIEAGGPAAQALDNLYDTTLAADLSSPNWRFANKTVQLSQIAGFNPDYMYFNTAYQVPPDCLAIWQVWPSVPYEIFGEQLWTTGNQELQMSYRALKPESMLPPAYINYFCFLLATIAAPGVVKDPNLIVQIEAMMTRARSQAMIVNTQGRPNQGLANSPWVNSRVAGSFYGTSWSN